MTRVAIIDLGTNTFHLLIADVSSDGVQVLHKEKKSVKIGENGISQGIIAEPAMGRAIIALQGFKQQIDAMEVAFTHATATSAFRNAENGQETADRIYRLTGIKINIIDGEQEAQLIYQGVRQALNVAASDGLIMDIGGGSVEFILVKDEEIQWLHSFEIGAQRLMDMFHHQDPISPEEIEKLETFLDQQLTELMAACREYEPTLLIGASGTFDTLSQIHCKSRGIDPSDQAVQPLSVEGFNEIYQLILHQNRLQRMAIPGMVEMRVDMIVVASCLINYVLRNFNIGSISVSSFALKEGVLHEISQDIINQGN